MSCLDRSKDHMKQELRKKEHKLFHLSCLHCGYSRSAVEKKKNLTGLPLRWMENGWGDCWKERRESSLPLRLWRSLILRRPLRCCYITTETLQSVLGTVKKAVFFFLVSIRESRCLFAVSVPHQLETRGQRIFIGGGTLSLLLLSLTS